MSKPPSGWTPKRCIAAALALFGVVMVQVAYKQTAPLAHYSLLALGLLSYSISTILLTSENYRYGRYVLSPQRYASSLGMLWYIAYPRQSIGSIVQISLAVASVVYALIWIVANKQRLCFEEWMVTFLPLLLINPQD